MKMKKAEKALTKAELVKLYEEFKERKKKEHANDVAIYERYMMFCLKQKLSTKTVMWSYCFMLPEKIKKEDFEKAYDEILDGKPTYTEPTFNEFMESLGEKKGFEYFVLETN